MMKLTIKWIKITDKGGKSTQIQLIAKMNCFPLENDILLTKSSGCQK